MKPGFPSLTFLTCAFSALATFAALTPRAEADTTLTATFNGTFVREFGDPDTDIALGDQFRFTITFDDSQIDTSAGLQVNSILSTEFLVNGIPHAHTAPFQLGLSPNQPWMNNTTLPGAFNGINVAGPNNIYMYAMRLGFNPFLPAASQGIGSTVEFSDFLLFNGYRSTAYTGDLAMTDPFSVISGDGSILGEITTTTVVVVPEPAISVFTGFAALGICLLPRRRK